MAMPLTNGSPNHVMVNGNLPDLGRHTLAYLRPPNGRSGDATPREPVLSWQALPELYSPPSGIPIWYLFNHSDDPNCELRFVTDGIIQRPCYRIYALRHIP